MFSDPIHCMVSHIVAVAHGKELWERGGKGVQQRALKPV